MTAFTIAQVSEEEPRTWDGPNGTILYFKVKLEDGQVAQVGRQALSPPPQSGDRYEDGHLEPPKFDGGLPTLKGGQLRSGRDDSSSATSLMIKGSHANAASGSTVSDKYKADPDKLREETKRSALHAAASNAAPDATTAQVLERAEAYWNWIKDET